MNMRDKKMITPGTHVSNMCHFIDIDMFCKIESPNYYKSEKSIAKA